MTERTTVTKTFSLPPDVAAELKSRAGCDGLPESLIVRWALERYFNATDPAKVEELKAQQRRRKPRKAKRS